MPKFSSSHRDAWDSSHGSAAGKGDSPRHKLEKFRANYDGIKWGGPKGLKGKRFRKVYGAKRTKPISFTELAHADATFTGGPER